MDRPGIEPGVGGCHATDGLAVVLATGSQGTRSSSRPDRSLSTTGSSHLLRPLTTSLHQIPRAPTFFEFERSRVLGLRMG
ncbi:MAG: hypothetical protein ACK53L_09305, partial [Pirellulaceae bacterium]